MDPQFVFLVWLRIFVVGCFVTGYRDDAARKSWRPDFFLSGITILRWTFSANYAQLHMPTVEALNRRFASNWGWTTTFRQIAPNHIAFQGGEKGRNPRNALVHGRIEFNATTPWLAGWWAPSLPRLAPRPWFGDSPNWPRRGK